MRVLALDLSLRRTGWCRDGLESPCPPVSGVWRSPSTKLGAAGRMYQDWLYRIIGHWGIELVAYEAPIFGSTRRSDGGGGIVMNEETVIGLVGLAFVTECMADARGIPAVRGAVSTIRKHFLGTGRPAKPKPEVMARCKLLGWTPASYDESDAAAVWAWAKATHCRGFHLTAASPLFPAGRDGGMKFRALDLFCGAGGVARGLQMAGYDVTGVDIKPQPRYVGDRFIQADATQPPVDLSRFDLIWASPPCQRYVRVWNGQEHMRDRYPDLIPATRSLLAASGALTCIENVPGAPIRPDLVLTGAQFDLDIVRDRLFELGGFSVPFSLVPQHAKTVTNGDLACVAGHGANNAWNVRRKRGPYPKWKDLPEDLRRRLCDRNNKAGWSEAMGIDWMTCAELSQAIPPAYAEYIGRHALQYLEARAA